MDHYPLLIAIISRRAKSFGIKQNGYKLISKDSVVVAAIQVYLFREQNHNNFVKRLCCLINYETTIRIIEDLFSSIYAIRQIVSELRISKIFHKLDGLLF